MVDLKVNCFHRQFQHHYGMMKYTFIELIKTVTQLSVYVWLIHAGKHQLSLLCVCYDAGGCLTKQPFNYQQDFSSIDFRKHPEYYRVGRGEQGVLLVEPYKSEILPWWRYKDRVSAAKSAEKIYQMFEEWRRQDDFVGMDMARKFIQMGYTRARRYANYKGGKKYAPDGSLNPRGNDPVKAAAAAVFKVWWDRIRSDRDYLRRKREHQSRWG